MNTFDVPPSNEWSKILSHREFTIAILVARCQSNKKVAHEFGLTEGTLEVHLNRIFQKLAMQLRPMLRGANSLTIGWSDNARLFEQ